jgi:hypothetical protein
MAGSLSQLITETILILMHHDDVTGKAVNEWMG